MPLRYALKVCIKEGFLMTKYAVTLGEFYTNKVGVTHYADTLKFETEYGKDTFIQSDIELKGLERHGNKEVIPVPDWYVPLYNSLGTPYDGTYNGYMAMLENYLHEFKWNQFEKGQYKSLERIFNALYAEYSPIENTDRMSTITDSKTGTDFTAYEGSETNTHSGDITTNYGKKNTEKFDETEETAYNGGDTSTNTKQGSILENGDKDDYLFPFNGTEKEHTGHTDDKKNTRYGKYKDADGNPTDDPYIDTTTNTYNGRSDVKTHTTGANGNSYESSGNDTVTNNLSDKKQFENRKDTTTYGSQNTHEEHTHGNIGVSTSQSMVSEEIALRAKYAMLDIIVDEYVNTFCY